MPTVCAGSLTAEDVRRIASPAERRRVIIEAIYPDLRKLCRQGMLSGTARQFDSIEDATQEAALALCARAGEYDPDYRSESGKPVKPLTRLLWLIRADMQRQLTMGRRMPTVLSGDAARQVTYKQDGRASDGDPAIVLGMPMQRELFR